MHLYMWAIIYYAAITSNLGQMKRTSPHFNDIKKIARFGFNANLIDSRGGGRGIHFSFYPFKIVAQYLWRDATNNSHEKGRIFSIKRKRRLFQNEHLIRRVSFFSVCYSFEFCGVYVLPRFYESKDTLYTRPFSSFCGDQSVHFTSFGRVLKCILGADDKTRKIC